jgi:hypothetical protein
VLGARERAQLGAMLAADTVLVLQPATRGVCWLWTLHRVVDTYDGAFARRVDAATMSRFARAVADVVLLAWQGALEVSLLPSAFTLGDPPKYVGDLRPAKKRDVLVDAHDALLEDLARRGVAEDFSAAWELALESMPGERRRDVELALRQHERVTVRVRTSEHSPRISRA